MDISLVLIRLTWTEYWTVTEQWLCFSSHFEQDMSLCNWSYWRAYYIFHMFYILCVWQVWIVILTSKHKMCYSLNLYENGEKYLKVALVPACLHQSVSQVLVSPYCLEHMGSRLGLPCWLADSKSPDIIINNRGQLWDNTVQMIKIHFWLPWDMMLIIS